MMQTLGIRLETNNNTEEEGSVESEIEGVATLFQGLSIHDLSTGKN